MVAPYEEEKQGTTSSLPHEFDFLTQHVELISVVQRLLQLGETVKESFGKPEYEACRKSFETAVDEAFDNPRTDFLLTELHPIFDVTCVGFIRHYIGNCVGGKAELRRRVIGRGVSDKSGR